MPSVFSGALLSAKIKSSGFRLEQLALATGLSYRYLERLGRGEARPSTRALERLADALGSEPGDFFADDGKSRGIPDPPGSPPPPPLTEQTREKLRALLDLRA